MQAISFRPAGCRARQLRHLDRRDPLATIASPQLRDFAGLRKDLLREISAGDRFAESCSPDKLAQQATLCKANETFYWRSTPLARGFMRRATVFYAFVVERRLKRLQSEFANEV